MVIDQKDTQKIIRFGRYLLLDHLVDGGMATIWRARFLAEQADKIVAIKMVQSNYSKDPAFRTMFMNEIKVAFALIHPNIAQTYEYGDHEGQLFTAIEYVDGRNLKQYLDKLKELNLCFPVDVAVNIIAQSCQGLYYAHTFKDKLTGKEANIIHRDISPHNIMLSYDGAVKIIDFGIAKANTNSDATQAGTIKGKLSYLAPEYLDGAVLDPRYDQFALGITLWELLCSRKLFRAENDLAVLKKIQACQVPPPSSINKNVPKELDDIVLKALSKDRNNRYEDMDQFNRALIRFLYSQYPNFNATDLQRFAEEIFKKEIALDKEKMFAHGQLDITPFLEEIRNEKQGGTKTSSKPDIAGDGQGKGNLKRKTEKVLDFGFEQDVIEKTRSISLENPLRNQSKSSEEPPKVNKAPNAVAKNTATDLGVSTNKITQSDIKRIAKKDSQSLEVSQSKGVLSRFLPLIIILVLILGVGLYLFDRPFVVGKFQKLFKGTSVDMVEKKTQTQVVPKDGLIEITNFNNKKQKVFINGKEVLVSVLGEIKYPLSPKIVLRVEQQDRKNFVATFSLTPDDSEKQLTIPEMDFVAYGYLITSSNCIYGQLELTLFGEERIEELPLGGRKIPIPMNLDQNRRAIPTEYEVVFVRAGESIKRKQLIKINRQDDLVDFCEFLGP